MTEEFVTSYRMHPLLRDEYEIHSHRTGALVERTDFEQLHGPATRPAVDRWGWSDLLYSFGTMNPGDITLHNHPDCLRDLARISGEHVDVGTVDILRDRERGVPRYTAFRSALHRPPVSGFEELTGGDVGLAAELREVYDGRLDRVDTMVGMYAEPRPRGFAFSDTAFRIFTLMASRRLKSDRFFTSDYRPEIYTPEGMEWIERTGMTDVLLRHHPELAPALHGVRNVFAPWRMLRPGGSADGTGGTDEDRREGRRGGARRGEVVGPGARAGAAAAGAGGPAAGGGRCGLAAGGGGQGAAEADPRPRRPGGDGRALLERAADALSDHERVLAALAARRRENGGSAQIW
ncbi:peroxidase family protein [Streptomyces stramineus]